MITTIIRVLIIYAIILFVFRIMGKRQIAQMQPFEFVLTLIIADLATIPMAESSIPILSGIVPLLTLVLFHFALTSFTRLSNKFSKFISGKPIIIVSPDGINYKALKQLNITIDDLFEAMRSSGYFNLSDVLYAIMETNGKVSIMPTPESAPVVASDLNINNKITSLPLTIINEGKFMEENLKLSKKNKDYYINLLKLHNITNVKDVLLVTINNDGEIYLQVKNKAKQVLKA